MESKKPDIEMENRLFSSNETEVISALQFIKEEGDLFYLPLLFRLLNSDPEENIEEEILFILNNLKYKDAAKVLADAIRDPGYVSIRKKLISACWQNGLDYSEFFSDFVNLIINEKWEIGFEALTVIENMKVNPSQDTINKETVIINNAIKNVGKEKQYLLQEILTRMR